MRHQRQLVLVGAPALALCLVGPAAAGSISISIAPVVEPREGALSAQVKVSNVGDETAQSVAAVLVFGEHKARGEIHPSLAPGASVDAALSLPVGELGTGHWPYQIAIDYTDANQYPLFAEVQYDDEGVHQAVAGQGIVEIEAAHSYFEVRRTWFWIAAGVLVALWVGILLWRGLAARSRRAESRP